MKLKFGLNLNSILLAIVFSVVAWLVFKLYRVTEGLTMSDSKIAYDNANAILEQLTTDLATIETANAADSEKYRVDLDAISAQIALQTTKINSQKLIISRQTALITIMGISPNINDMKKQYNIEKRKKEQLIQTRIKLKADRIIAIEKYNTDKTAKQGEIDKQKQLVDVAQKAYELYPPIINSVTPGDKEIVLSISPLMGTTPMSYSVTYGTPTVTKTLTPLTIDEKYTIYGLTNGTQYTFSVTANFANGTTSNAATSRLVKPISQANPSAPRRRAPPFASTRRKNPFTFKF
jgi:hypothetical protein